MQQSGSKPESSISTREQHTAGKRPVGPSQMDPQRLNREAFGCKWPAQSWSSLETSLMSVCRKSLNFPLQNHCLMKKQEHTVTAGRGAEAEESSRERAQPSPAPQPCVRTGARQLRAASKSQAEENTPCQASVKWCADSQPPIVCVLGRLPSPAAVARAREGAQLG